jgi:predicted MFS family arabinose efflux permease
MAIVNRARSRRGVTWRQADGSSARLLRLAAVRWQAATGLLAQVSQGAAAVGIILVVRGHAGSLALAGVVVAALFLTAGVARPVQGRLIDLRGTRPVMAASGIAHAGALAGIVAVSGGHGSAWILVALGCVAGLSLPPVSTSMRVEWAKLALDDRTGAYSLVYLTQELAILGGPLIFAAVTAAASASLGLLVVAVLAGVGAAGFAASVPPLPGRAPQHAGASGAVLRIRGAQLLLLIALLIGAVIGGLQVAAPTLAVAHRRPAAAGLLIASVSVGGIVGAAAYGTRRWQWPPWRRLPVLLVALAGALALLIPAERLVVAGLIMLAAGLALNPALTTLSLLIDRHVPAGSAGEAFGWLSTALAAGTAGASALAAALVQQHRDPRAAFVVAAVAGLAAAALSAGSGRSRRRPRLDEEARRS